MLHPAGGDEESYTADETLHVSLGWLEAKRIVALRLHDDLNNTNPKEFRKAKAFREIFPNIRELPFLMLLAPDGRPMGSLLGSDVSTLAAEAIEHAHDMLVAQVRRYLTNNTLIAGKKKREFYHSLTKDNLPQGKYQWSIAIQCNTGTGCNVSCLLVRPLKPLSPLTIAAMTDLDSLCCSRRSHLSRLLHGQRPPHSRRSRLLPPSCDLLGPPVLPQATQMHPPLAPATRHWHWVSPIRTTCRLAASNTQGIYLLPQSSSTPELSPCMVMASLT